MDKAHFIKILKRDARDYSNRPILVDSILKNPDWIEILLEDITESEQNELDFNARILELLCKSDSKLILPYLDIFISVISNLKKPASIRASAKIIELLMVEYFVKFNPIYHEKINNQDLEKLTECCFDWILTNKSTAIQAHSMYCLYLLGSEFDWIHAELIQNLEKNIQFGSTGYQNRAMKIINAIKTNKLLKLY